MATNVSSSNLMSVSYEYATWRLHVWFNAAPNVEYVYENVPPDVFIEVLLAPSVGSTFHRRIRSRPQQHPYEKVIYLEY